MGERITPAGYAHMNPKQEITLTVTKKQQKATEQLAAQSCITFWQCFKHTTNQTTKQEYLPFGQNFLSLDFNDL